jgi:hypothetical protein
MTIESIKARLEAVMNAFVLAAGMQRRNEPDSCEHCPTASDWFSQTRKHNATDLRLLLDVAEAAQKFLAKLDELTPLLNQVTDLATAHGCNPFGPGKDWGWERGVLTVLWSDWRERNERQGNSQRVPHCQRVHRII